MRLQRSYIDNCLDANAFAVEERSDDQLFSAEARFRNAECQYIQCAVVHHIGEQRECSVVHLQSYGQRELRANKYLHLSARDRSVMHCQRNLQSDEHRPDDRHASFHRQRVPDYSVAGAHRPGESFELLDLRIAQFDFGFGRDLGYLHGNLGAERRIHWYGPVGMRRRANENHMHSFEVIRDP